MKYLIIAIALISNLGVYAQSGNSLQVVIKDGSTLVYPPNTKFEVRNEAGELQFNEGDLKADMILDIDNGEELTVFTSWASGKDIFKPKSAYLSLLETVERQDKEEKKKFWEVGQPQITSETYSKNNKGGFNAEVAFEGQIKFTFMDGDAKIYEKGKKLELIGNYIAKTDKGLLKLSYQPENKKLYYVFSDDLNEPVVVVK